jgi:hypothetical protein
LRDATADRRLLDRSERVKIDRATMLHAVFHVEDDLRGNSSNRRSDTCNRDFRKMGDRAWIRQHNHWPLLVWRRKHEQSNLAAF